MKLTVKAIEALEPRDKDYKVSDGEGLYLLVKKSGAKYWRMKYRFGKKEKTYSIGVYPEVSLKDARKEKIIAKNRLAEGLDPTEHKGVPTEEDVLTFKDVGKSWFSTKCKSGWSDKTIKKNGGMLDKWVYPTLGNKPFGEQKPLDILAVIRKLEDQELIETAHRVRGLIDNIYQHGIILGHCETNPASEIKGALINNRGGHYAALTEPDEVASLMLAAENYHGSVIVKLATFCSAYWFCRPGEVRHMEWAFVDMKNRMITIPKDRMKQVKNGVNHDHMIPISTQSAQILQELYMYTYRSKYVFPSVRSNDRPMSENTVRLAIRAMGFDASQMSAHGFRATARTLLDEELGFRPDVIEHQLAHEVRDSNGRAYNRTSHMQYRVKMMQAWADYLHEIMDEKRNGNTVARRSLTELPDVS